MSEHASQSESEATLDASAKSENASADASTSLDAASAVQTPSEAAPLRESTVARELLAGVIAAAIALGCVLPPLVHFVTGPLGPAIGGYVVAHHLKPGSRGRAIIAAVLGLSLAGLGAGATAIVLRASGGEPPSWFPSREQLGLVLAGVFAYAAALGAVGATLGARTGRAH